MIFKFRYFSFKTLTLWLAYGVFHYILEVEFTSLWLAMSSEMPSDRKNLDYPGYNMDATFTNINQNCALHC